LPTETGVTGDMAGLEAGGRVASVCFLYIAQAHQVLHSLSAAVELARRCRNIRVDVAATSRDVLTYAQQITDQLGGAPIGFRLLGPAWLRSWRDAGGAPLKMPMLAANAHDLAGYDVIVTPERTTAALRRFGVGRSKLVYTQHGAGDRAGPFEPRLGRFDLVFAAGQKQRDRMVASGLVAPERCAVVGYPKFDLISRIAEPLPQLFAEPRPIVLYNPHFDPRLSSWPRFGRQVLDAFAAQRRYNLVFAPHLRLFGGRDPAQVAALAPYRDSPSIHMDLGSGTAAIDMTYLRMADVYLGDASSQIYEFLLEPRPCAFLDAHHTDWRGDESYRHWRFGPVLASAERLVDAIDEVRATHSRFRPEQVAGSRYTFSVEADDPSTRAAKAIAGLIGRELKAPDPGPRVSPIVGAAA
jgi:hypothetical protein